MLVPLLDGDRPAPSGPAADIDPIANVGAIRQSRSRSVLPNAEDIGRQRASSKCCPEISGRAFAGAPTDRLPSRTHPGAPVYKNLSELTSASREINAQCVMSVNAYGVIGRGQTPLMPKRKGKTPKKERHEPSEFWQRLVDTWKDAGRVCTQSSAARAVNNTQSTAQRWENGSSVPERPKLQVLARLGNTTVDYLLFKRGPKHPPDETLTWLMNAYQRLDQDGKDHILAAARGALALLGLDPQRPDATKSDGESERPAQRVARDGRTATSSGR